MKALKLSGIQDIFKTFKLTKLTVWIIALFVLHNLDCIKKGIENTNKSSFGFIWNYIMHFYEGLTKTSQRY